MAKVTNAFTTYQATANREDLSNAIYNIDPFDTPVMSAIRRRNVKNRIFDWQTEHLPLVNATNADVEGFQLSPSVGTPTVRVNNCTQISHRDATVSGTQEESDAAGKGSEMAHQMAMAAKVLGLTWKQACARAGPQRWVRTRRLRLHALPKGSPIGWPAPSTKTATPPPRLRREL